MGRGRPKKVVVEESVIPEATGKKINALALVKNEDGHFAIATLVITGNKVETLELSNFNLLQFAMARAHMVLQQHLIDLRKA